MKVTVKHQFLPKTNSTRASQVMDHFGIDFEQGDHCIAEDLELPIRAGQLVLFTGESGSGKSSLMQAVTRKLQTRDQQVVSLDELDSSDQLVAESFDLSFLEVIKLLAGCGLGEAHLMLRRPSELSDGQRYRFNLARALAQKTDWVVADEFTATLDRTLAKVVAFNLRKQVNDSQKGVLLATTHLDVLDDLDPDLHVHCHLDRTITITERSSSSKKKVAHSIAVSGFPARPNPTGRTSLAGITGATSWD